MATTRKIRRISKSQPTMEGAGVHLNRAFGFREVPDLDPFLLLDDFRGDRPDQYIKGFPWHPHRGIETITYVLCGEVAHGDSLGNSGVISGGDVQWMTAGSGIIHQEMPKGEPDGRMYGFQLWANLPRLNKMMGPRYRDVKSEQIPEVALETGTMIKLVCGEVAGARGPVRDIVIDPEYLDVTVPAETEFIHPTKRGHTVFAYVTEGRGYFSEERDSRPLAENRTLLVFEDGEQIKVRTEESSVRFLLISGKPIGEPVAWYGPIVMNTQAELDLAFREYQDGTFIKHKRP